MTTLLEKIQSVIASDGGMLRQGIHPNTYEYCLLEAVSVVKGFEKVTDDPISLDVPDLRALNDGHWSSDAMRTEWTLKLVPLIEEWWSWRTSRRREWAEKVVIRTIQEIIPPVFRADGMESQAKAMAGAADLGAARAAACVAGNMTIGTYSCSAANEAFLASKQFEFEDTTYVSWRASRAVVYAAEAAHNITALEADKSLYESRAKAEAADKVLQQAIRVWIES